MRKYYKEQYDDFHKEERKEKEKEMKFIKLHDRDNYTVIFNIESIAAIYYDEEQQTTAIDYGAGETFYIKEKVEEIESALGSLIYN